MGRRSTGIGVLDEMMEGGFKDGSINMVDGQAGTGKSTLAVHYIDNGLNEGESAIYMSIEEDKEDFYDNMSRYGFDLKKYEDENRLLFYECNAQKLKDFIDKGSLGIEDKIMSMKPTRFVLDSISAFALLYDSEMNQRIAVQRLMEKIKTWKFTTLLLSEASQDYTRYGLEYMADGVVRLEYRKVGHERVRTVEVVKMRGTKHQSVETVYRLEANGMVLYPSETIF